MFHKKTVLIWFFLCTTILLIGAGCGSETQESQTPQQEQIQQVTKKPIGVDSIDLAYRVCENNGNTVGFQYDESTESTKTYCVFPDNTACDIISFITGACNHASGAIAYKKPDSAIDLTQCDYASGPVCSTDNKTYSNECLAIVQKKDISHLGACKVSLTIPGAPSPLAGSNKPSTEQIGQASWIPLLIDLVQAEPVKSPPAFIEQCQNADTALYFQSNGCSDCFSVLYDFDGEVLCYPNNDINANCPATFNRNSCTRIWTDPR